MIEPASTSCKWSLHISSFTFYFVIERAWNVSLQLHQTMHYQHMLKLLPSFIFNFGTRPLLFYVHEHTNMIQKHY